MYSYPQYQIPVQQVYSPQVLQNMHCIIEPSDGRGGLYLGDLLATMRTDQHIQYNLGGILSVAIDAKYNKTYDPRIQHILSKHILAYDFPNYDISQHFQECNQWIQNILSQGMGVLVHCRAGISRSASIVIAYLMKKYNMTFQQAYSHTKARRNKIQPNEGFKQHLRQYETRIFRPDSSKSVILNSRSPATQQSLKYSVVRFQEGDDKTFTAASQLRQSKSGAFPFVQPFSDNNITIDRPTTPLIKSQTDLRRSAYFATPKVGNKTQRYFQEQSPESAYYSNQLIPQQMSPYQQQVQYYPTQPFVQNYASTPTLSSPMRAPQTSQFQQYPQYAQYQAYPQYSSPKYQAMSVSPQVQKAYGWGDWVNWRK